MNEDGAKLAREALIVYGQLTALKDMLEKFDYAEKRIIYIDTKSLAISFNMILIKMKEVFEAVDKSFLNSINYINALPKDAERSERGHELVLQPMKTYIPIMIGSLNIFLQLYLAPEDKKKTIGFQPPEK
jgi:hypothetical protein